MPSLLPVSSDAISSFPRTESPPRCGGHRVLSPQQAGDSASCADIKVPQNTHLWVPFPQPEPCPDACT